MSSRLKTVKTYNPDHMKLIYEAKDELEQGVKPELQTYPDMTGYDTVFLGYPNWWNHLPMPVVSFLDHTGWAGKRIIPFVTSGGSGFGDSLADLRAHCPGAQIAAGGAFLGHEVESSGPAIAAWAKAQLRDPA